MGEMRFVSWYTSLRAQREKLKSEVVLQHCFGGFMCVLSWQNLSHNAAVLALEILSGYTSHDKNAFFDR